MTYVMKDSPDNVERVDRRLQQLSRQFKVGLELSPNNDGTYNVVHFRLSDPFGFRGTYNSLPWTLDQVAQWLEGVFFGMAWTEQILRETQ